MDRFVIDGGYRLTGEITVGGAKNAALPVLAATLLSSEPYWIEGIPRVRDVLNMQKLLRFIGATITGDEVVTKHIDQSLAPYDLVKTMRAAVLVLGPLLARCGEAHVALPGGCAIGPRPVGMHLDGLKQMGAEIHVEHGMIHASAVRLKGAQIRFETTTVTGTENLMMAATLADGETILDGAACEPEVVDLAHFLMRCGAKISGAGSARICIQGVDQLNGTSHGIIPDRIEAATFLIAAAITQGDVVVCRVQPESLANVIDALRLAGLEITVQSDAIHLRAVRPLQTIRVSTAPYPGFPTDVQPQITALMSLANGMTTVHETIFENRFSHVPELIRMGAEIAIDGNCLDITGVPRLSAAHVMASDLRAGVALVLAGLAAEGETCISRIYHVDRGYERLEEKLGMIGAHIRRLKAL